MGKQARLRRQRRTQQVEGMLLQDKIMEVYAEVAPALIYRHFSVDCCLNATRVAIDVLHGFGIEARPLTTKVMVFNKAMWDKVQAKGDLPSKEEMDEWVEAGAWCLGVDGQMREGQDGWPWHLVAVTKDRMLDSSSLQMSRPHRSIKVSPVITAPIPKGFERGASKLILRNDDDAVLMYTGVPEVEDYKTKPGFQRSAHNLDMARSIMQLVDAKLKSEPKTS